MQVPTMSAVCHYVPCHLYLHIRYGHPHTFLWVYTLLYNHRRCLPSRKSLLKSNPWCAKKSMLELWNKVYKIRWMRWLILLVQAITKRAHWSSWIQEYTPWLQLMLYFSSDVKNCVKLICKVVLVYLSCMHWHAYAYIYPDALLALIFNRKSEFLSIQ